MSIDTETSLETWELESLEDERCCEPVLGTCDRPAAFFLVIACGDTFAACAPHKEQQELVNRLSPWLVCFACHRVVSGYRWEPIR